MARKNNQQHEELIRALEIALAQGYVWINEQERELLNLLRFTTYHGRNLVMETAIAMRCTHPWRDTPNSLNLHSLHPSGDPRFANHADIDPR
ncbi:MAG: hypothetical protein WA049_06640 [Ferribacterium limneticum]